MLRVVLFTLIGSLIFVGCTAKRELSKTAAPARQKKIEQFARVYLDPVIQEYQTRLQQSLSKKGAAESLDECRLDQGKLYRKKPKYIVEVGRSSHRPRSPMNAPMPWQDEVLQLWKSSTASNPVKPEGMILPGGEWAYARPIYLNQSCLACHGKSISSAVQDQLNTHYLQDKALGYEEGDFAGIYWLKLSKP